MDQELKARWIAALESGEYSKTTRTLRDDFGYCCLGVLCDITGEVDDLNAEWSMPDYRLQSQWGLNEIAPFTGRSITSVLASLNDKSDSFVPVIEKIKELL